MPRPIISPRSIRTLKKHSGLSDAKLAHFLSVTRETFNKWKYGKQRPNTIHSYHLARLYYKFVHKPLPLGIKK